MFAFKIYSKSHRICSHASFHLQPSETTELKQWEQ